MIFSGTIPFGAPDDVKAEVLLRLQTIGRGGGLLIGPHIIAFGHTSGEFLGDDQYNQRLLIVLCPRVEEHAKS